MPSRQAGSRTTTSTGAANLPLVTWLEWLQQFAVAHTSSLAADRAPTVVVLLLTWFLCRRSLGRVLGRRPHLRDTAWWSATLMFCLGIVAFGMSLRPEPVVALLAVGVLACCLRYASEPTPGALVAGVLLAGLAVTAHPAGLVAATPLAICGPRIWRDVRDRTLSVLSLAAVILVGAAWTVLLAFVDSDLATRTENARLFRQVDSQSAGVLQELDRYANLSSAGGSTVRREFVPLLVLSVVALVAGRFWRRTLPELLPTASVALSLVVLTGTPSKWIWHFGGLIGLAAVAVGVEASRLARRTVAPLRFWVFAVALVSATMWAALEPWEWGPLDVGRLRWTHLPGPFVLATVVAAVLVLVLWRAGRVRRPELGLFNATVGGLLAVTFFVLAADAVATDGWTAPRQAVSSLVATDGCGVADDLLIPTSDSMRALEPVRRPQPRHESGGRRSRRPPLSGTALERLVPRPLVADRDVRQGRLVARGPDLSWRGDTFRRTGRVRRLGTGVIAIPGPRPRAVCSSDGYSSRSPVPPAASGRGRGVDLDRPGESTARGVSSAGLLSSRAADHRVLDPVDAASGRSVPVRGDAVCASSDARVRRGETPGLLVEWYWGANYATFTSPFRGAADVFHLVRVPVEGRDGDRERIVVHWPFTDPGDLFAAPTRRVLKS